MRSIQARCGVLILIFGAAAWLVLSMSPAAQQSAAPRWPTDDAVYALDSWASSSVALTQANGVQHITRTYSRPDGLAATFVISTSTEAKRIYRAGAEVPFLGSGFSTSVPDATLVPPKPTRSAILATRGDEVLLEMHAYGERRGLLGAGPLAWGLSGWDGLVGRSNDYYLARIIMSPPKLDADTGQAAGALADVLFARLAAWYAA